MAAGARHPTRGAVRAGHRFLLAYSAIDARRQGFEAVVTLDACRGIDLGGSLDAALAQMREAGVALATSLALPG